MTIDGYIAGPNGEMDFMTWNWGDDINQYIDALTDTADCIVLGRKLAQGFIPHWAAVAADPDNPDYASGKQFTDTHKVVFTQTLDHSEWENTVLANDDLVTGITQLKNEEGKDIIVYGGATFVSSLIKQGLIDDFHLFINPTAIGNGMPIFNELENNQNLTLVQSKAFDCGIVLLNYELKP